MTNHINQIKTFDILLVSSKHGTGSIIQKFQKKRDPVAGRWNHSAQFWWVNGILALQEQTQAPDQAVRANNNLTEFEKYLKGDSDLLHLQLKFNLIEKGLRGEVEKLLISENGRFYDFPNLLKFQIVRTLFNIWSDPFKKSRQKLTVCHEEAMLTTNLLFKKHYGLTPFPNWDQANVADLYHSNYYTRHSINKEAVLKSMI